LGVQANGNYLDQLPKPPHMWIAYVKDVQADENCGYQAIADLLGLERMDGVKSDVISLEN